MYLNPRKINDLTNLIMSRWFKISVSEMFGADALDIFTTQHKSIIGFIRIRSINSNYGIYARQLIDEPTQFCMQANDCPYF